MSLCRVDSCENAVLLRCLCRELPPPGLQLAVLKSFDCVFFLFPSHLLTVRRLCSFGTPRQVIATLLETPDIGDAGACINIPTAFPATLLQC
ncbi:uncharacterized protein QC761_106655 [Podospora bellae-mahoneyi]|uniref:Uncharacterized protein n=1 Tax=Podospora bellae-mahoneyi TaxID=2093777 RepID=A0ABR0FVQ6_9PEZI|nr:hypothetical protein QC761_106655 [Podospora bellae-mahoneyi]